jgi:hypothetical protein
MPREQPHLVASHDWIPVLRHEPLRSRLGPLRPSLARYVGEAAREDLWLEVPLGSGWRAAWRLLPRAGRLPVLAELRIMPDEAGHPAGEWSASVLGRRARAPKHALTARLLRQATPERARHALAALVADLRRHPKADGLTASVAAFFLPKSTSTRKAGPRVGRPPKPARFYAEVAVNYHEIEIDRADGGSTRAQLAALYGVPATTVAGWLRTARRLGFLTPTKAGSRHSVATADAFATARRRTR